MHGLRSLWRDWRGGDLVVVLAGVVLAVAIVCAVGLFSDRLGSTINDRSSQLLGGDLVLQAPREVDPHWLAARPKGVAVSRSVGFATMLSSGDSFQIASVRAVDSHYPLRGQVDVATGLNLPAHALDRPVAAGEIWVDSRVLDALHLSIGDRVDIGDISLRIAGILTREPEGLVSSLAFAPPALMALSDLDRAGVVQPGSRVSWRYYFAGPTNALAHYRAWLQPKLTPENRLYGVREGRPRVAGAIDRARSYLLLGAALGVTLAGAAIAVASRRYSERQIQVVAVMKTLGASLRQINRLYAAKLAWLALFGTLAGALLGWGLQWLLAETVVVVRGVALQPAGWQPWLLGVITGAVCVGAFGLPPVLALAEVSPLAALRRDSARIARGGVVSWLVGGGAVIALMLGYTRDVMLTAAVLAGVSIAVIVVLVMAHLLLSASRQAGMQAGDVWRLATSSLGRRRFENAMQVVIFSITLMLLLILLVIRTSLLDDWRQQLPPGTPNYFLVNIPPEQVAGLRQWLGDRHIDSAGLYPIVRARLTAINGESVTGRVNRDMNDTASIDRELNLTWSAQLPSDNRLTAGRWWRAGTDEAVVSVAARLAKQLGIHIGDRLTFRSADRSFTVRVSSLRAVQWERMRPNFFMILPERVLSGYAATYITSFYLPAARKPVLAQLVRAFPAVTLLDIGAMIEQVRDIVSQVTLAVEAVLWLVVGCGTLVLVATVRSSMAERYRESAILRTLGAPARLVLGALAVEFVLLGLVAGLLAALGAEMTSWVLADRVFHIRAHLHWLVWLVGPLVGAAVVGATGLLTSRRVVHTPPVSVLRAVD